MSQQQPRVLIVGQDATDNDLLRSWAQEVGADAATAASLTQADELVQQNPPELILAAMHLPDGRTTDHLYDLSRFGSRVVLVAEGAELEDAIRAMEQGATDYLLQPLGRERLQATVKRLVCGQGRRSQAADVPDPHRRLARFGFMYGSCPQLRRVYEQISRVAPTEATVFITGESGTGKELVARTVHHFSERSNKPFLPINCGAISPQLIESELFGHEKGSFTGAVREHRGVFERADGGTLFLDEITEMPVELQVKLLRVLETGLFSRIGSDRETACDVRIITATNRDPEGAVSEGKLRHDLLYRLQVFPISLPPLRDRGEDVVLLANHFLQEFNEREATDKQFSREALQRIQRYSWPGNLRELKNIVYRGFIMARHLVEASHLPLPADSERPTGPSLTINVGRSVASVERDLILATLHQCNGRKERAARMLGVSVKTLYNRLKDYEAFEPPEDDEAEAKAMESHDDGEDESLPPDKA